MVSVICEVDTRLDRASVRYENGALALVFQELGVEISIRIVFLFRFINIRIGVIIDATLSLGPTEKPSSSADSYTSRRLDA